MVDDGLRRSVVRTVKTIIPRCLKGVEETVFCDGGCLAFIRSKEA